MKEQPILYTARNVLAILAGRKTQTRRVLKLQEFGCLTGDCPHDKQSQCDEALRNFCPYGKVGDRLWVRETHALEDAIPRGNWVIYRADNEARHWEIGDNTVLDSEFDPRTWPTAPKRWRPSIFMPRWASRITLDITGIRVERLQDISEAEAKSEGIERCHPSPDSALVYRDYGQRARDPFEWFGSPINSFRSLWESINGPKSWDVNPFVWVIEFKRV